MLKAIHEFLSKLTPRKCLGWFIILTMFGTIFGFAVRDIGWLMAVAVFGGIAIGCVLLVKAIDMIMS